MRGFQKLLWVRVVAILLLVVDIPFMTGLDRMLTALRAEELSDPENYVYELVPNDSIRDLAKSHNYSALEIFEWVRKNVAYEPYFGSVKGAQGTFASLSGNDLDKAMLLGALLNESNVSWKLCVGSARLTMEQAMSWLGVSSSQQAGLMLRTANIPHTMDSQNPPQFITLTEHHWLEINSDYFLMRGAAADDVLTGTVDSSRDPEEAWVALDPTVTGYDSREEINLADVIGGDSAALYEALTSGPAPLPAAKILSAATRSANAVKAFLTGQNLQLSEALQTSRAVTLKTRGGLPANLPYQVLEGPTSSEPTLTPLSRYLPDELEAYLDQDVRRMLRVTLKNASGTLNGLDYTFSSPRLAVNPLSIRFDLLNPEEATDFLDVIDLPVSESLFRVKPVLSVGGGEVSDADHEFALGSTLWLEISEEGERITRLPIVAGGRYTLACVDRVDRANLKEIAEDLAARKDALGGGFAGEGSHNASLDAYLDLASQVTLHQALTLEETAAAVAGYRRAGRPPLFLSGLETSIVEGKVTSTSLTANYIASYNEAPPLVRVTEQEKAARSQAETLTAIMREVGYSHALEPLTGSGAYQSATFQMVLANEKNLAVRTLPVRGNITVLGPEVPNLSVVLPNDNRSAAVPLSQLAGEQLRSSALVMPAAELLGQDYPVTKYISNVPGEGTAKSAWGFWNVAAGTGITISPQGRVASASAPLDFLYPLDLVAGGSSERYKTLLELGKNCTGTAAGIPDSVAEGLAGPAAMVLPWLGNADGNPVKPQAIPAAAIALHGAAKMFERPQVEEVVALPKVLNTTQVDSNDPDPLDVLLRSSVPVESVTWRVANQAQATVFSLTEKPAQSVQGNGPDSDRTYVKTDLLTTAGADLQDGSYKLYGRASLAGGISSSEVADTFIVDNTVPAVELSLTTPTISGSFNIRGKAADANFESYNLRWRKAGDTLWSEPFTTGSSQAPLIGTLAVANTRALGWTGDVEVQLMAADKAGNQATTQTLYHAFNDIYAPQTTITSGDQAIANGSTLSDVVTLNFTASDSNPSPAENSGLASAKLTFVSEYDKASPPIALFEKTWLKGQTGHELDPTPAIISFDTSKVKRTYSNEVFKLVAEVTDKAGNVTKKETTGLKLGNALLHFSASPETFRPGYSNNMGRNSYALIQAYFAQPVLSWNLSIKSASVGDTTEYLARSGAGSSVNVEWEGTKTNGSFAPSGRYIATLTYNAGNGPKTVQASIKLASSEGHNPCIPFIETRPEADGSGDRGSSLSLSADCSAIADGAKFIITGETPYVVIHANPGESMRPFLDGGNSEEDSYPASFPQDGYWALEFKSSETTPTQTEPQDRRIVVVDRSNWHLIDWDDELPSEDNTTITRIWDTSNLPEGYYDVRLWVTDGFSPTYRVIYNLKISRATESPESGTESGIGAMTLSATDMTVPFNGFSANVTRSYNSQDIYVPGAFGYGWRLGSIGMEIERYQNQGSGEYDEAMVRLPDGRKFFFANNPAFDDGKQGQFYAGNMWAVKGEYLQRPYGMRLFRPGGSPMFHGSGASIYPAMPDSGPANEFLGPDRPITMYYTQAETNRTFGKGEVAYMQAEDKTWYIFEWKTGDLLEILKPDGQQVIFKKSSESEIAISDTSQRTITVQRNPQTHRISSITDPSGKAVTYEYDSSGNLSIVTDRSGRKRFYLYDTKETKALYPERTELTGSNPHFLVDVRVDDDLAADYRTARFTNDRVPDNLNEQDPQSFLAYQDWPGDVSILKSKYENGQLVGIETAGGSVRMDHEEGQEVVRDERTGAESKVVYDDQRRVTEQFDFYGQSTKFGYGESDNISGVLTQETNAFGQVTDYDYNAPAQAKHSSFADMFQEYVDRGILSSDIGGNGYLTGAQAQPTKITQQGPDGPVETQIEYGYQIPENYDKPFQFQPTGFDAPGGATGDLSYDDQTGKIKSVTVNGDGPVTTNQYYPEGDFRAGRLMKTIVQATATAPERSTSYNYSKDDARNEIHTVTDDATGLVTSSKYDSTGNLLSSTNARGVTVSTKTDGEGRITEASDEQGNTVYSYYNVLGQKYLERFSRVLETGVPPTNIWTRYTYDDAGRTVEVIREADAPDGTKRILSRSRTVYEETASGRTETSYNTLGLGSRSYYDAGGRLQKSEQLDAHGGIMSWSAYEYDKLGRKTKETNSKDIVTGTEYDELGRVKSTTVNGPGINQVTKNTYDAAGRVQSTSYEAGPNEQGQTTTRYTVYHYDSQGRLRFTFLDRETPDDPISDPEGRPGSNDGVYTETVYDKKTGQRIEEFDEERIATSYHYDDRGAVDKITLATTTSLASEFNFETDNFGNQTKIINPLGSVREKVYNEKGQLEFEFGPVCLQSTSTLYNKRQAVKYTYYASGQLKSKSEGTAPAGSQEISASRTTTYTYDPFTDQLLRRDFGNNVHDEYSYTDEGRLKRVDRWTTTSAASGEVALTHSRAFTYDPRTGQVATVTSPEGMIQYAYQDDGSLASIKTSAGYDVAYTYDTRGNIKTVSGSSVGGTVTYTYDGKTGRKTQVARPNGVTTAYVYDTRGFLKSITDANGVTPVLTQVYTRDDRGLVETLTETHQGETATVWTYGYDSLKRLSTAVATGQNPASYSYSYNKAGNRRSKTVDTGQPTLYSYNSLDQLIDESGPSGNKAYAYDVYGNLAHEYDGAVDNDPEKTYTWDQENKLKTVVVAGPAGKTYTYRYDVDGTRVSREISGSSAAAENGKTNYLSDYINPSGYSQTLEETTEEKENAYVWSGDGLLAQTGISASGESSGGGGPPASGTQYPHTDHLGTIKQLTAAGGATVGAGLKYSPFGELTGGSSDVTPYRFTGQYAEDALGLQYHRARWLDTAKAGWISEDPVWDFPGNFGNRYGYAGQNPCSFVDLSGAFSGVEANVSMAIVNTVVSCQSIAGNGAKEFALVALEKQTVRQAMFAIAQDVLLGAAVSLGLLLVLKVLSKALSYATTSFRKASLSSKILDKFEVLELQYAKRLAQEEADIAARLAKQKPSATPPHFFSDHGAGTSLEQQFNRATKGYAPSGRYTGLSDSSRFLSHKDQMEAFERIMEKYKSTGQNPVTIDMNRVVGEGYLKGASSADDLYFTTRVEAYFDKFGNLKTMFPKLN